MLTDWTKSYQKYSGQWVALQDDSTTIIASGETVREVVEKSKQQGVTEPILFRVPTKVGIGSTG